MHRNWIWSIRNSEYIESCEKLLSYHYLSPYSKLKVPADKTIGRFYLGIGYSYVAVS